MKVIIAGCRWFTDGSILPGVISRAGFRITEVVCGKAIGVDTLGEEWAKANGIHVEPFPANWKLHDYAAGFLRNQEMADYADALIAIWDGKTRGTKDMIERARKHGLKVYVHMIKEPDVGEEILC